MSLSKQYFTVLQLLRTAGQQIDVNFSEWQAVCGAAIGVQEQDNVSRFLQALTPSELTSNEQLKCWETQRDKVTQLLEAQTKHLKGRIDRKTEEVKSLRDGVRRSIFASCFRFPGSQLTRIV